jgi:23S rRNA pseudouridine1911/1915/1917 synthase
MEYSHAINPDTIVYKMVSPESDGKRIDQYLAQEFPGYSRSFFQKCIDNGHIHINGIAASKHSTPVKTQDQVQVHFPGPKQTITPAKVIDIGVQVIFEHEHFLIINKPAGLIVHAPHSTFEGISLVDWLICHFNDVSSVGPVDRPGIVHRLDKDTSGIMIIARTAYGMGKIGDMFKNRRIKKTYKALVLGHPLPEGSIDYPIDRRRAEPHKMTHLYGTGRPSLTHYRVDALLADAALITASPITGRTHQIRVHCAAIGHPIIGDATYGTSSKLIERQALHASTLAFSFEGQEYQFSASLPADFVAALEALAAQQLRQGNFLSPQNL